MTKYGESTCTVNISALLPAQKVNEHSNSNDCEHGRGNEITDKFPLGARTISRASPDDDDDDDDDDDGGGGGGGDDDDNAAAADDDDDDDEGEDNYCVLRLSPYTL